MLKGAPDGVIFGGVTPVREEPGEASVRGFWTEARNRQNPAVRTVVEADALSSGVVSLYSITSCEVARRSSVIGIGRKRRCGCRLDVLVIGATGHKRNHSQGHRQHMSEAAFHFPPHPRILPDSGRSAHGLLATVEVLMHGAP